MAISSPPDIDKGKTLDTMQPEPTILYHPPPQPKSPGKAAPPSAFMALGAP